METTNNETTTAQIHQLAIEVTCAIGPRVTIRGNVYRVSRSGSDVRFYAMPRYIGDIGTDAHIEILRSDFARAGVPAGGFRDSALELAAQRLVSIALAKIVA